jgi:TPP-dependent pyruvate/acetoin dehydrogenase alpha subunit
MIGEDRTMETPKKADRLGIFEKMLLIRRFEELCIETLPRHNRRIGSTYIGHEAAAAAVLQGATVDDFVFSTHRNHGYVLAKGIDPARALAEVFGREGGTNRGRGGPWHIADKSKGVLMTSAMLGGGTGLGVGAAFAQKMDGKGAASFVHLGDGTFPEGIVYEAFNMAKVMKLPVLFVCENNPVKGGRGWGMLSFAALTDLPRAMGIACEGPVDGGDADAVFAAATRALARIRAGEGPVFLQTDILAWPGAKLSPPALPYGRTDLNSAFEQKEFDDKKYGEWWKQDPVLRYVRALVGEKQATLDELLAVDRRIDGQLERALAYAEASPKPAAETALDNVFA